MRLIAPDSIIIYLMQPIIREILYEAPRVNLVFNSLPSEEINQAIVNGTADIGIDCDKGHFPDTAVHLPARPFHACLIASPFMAPAERDFITSHQRKTVSMILNEPYANYQKGIAAYLD
ncbi:MAG: hypothetical protein LUF84_00060 [Clostridiales bacterium]|nr:hypothetical protein [Clostridiales bacterium]